MLELGPILRSMLRNKVAVGLLMIEIAFTMAVVVNCLNLEVDDTSGVARIGGHVLLTGDHIAIDGLSGGVYLGEHRIADVGGAGRLK